MMSMYWSRLRGIRSSVYAYCAGSSSVFSVGFSASGLFSFTSGGIASSFAGVTGACSGAAVLWRPLTSSAVRIPSLFLSSLPNSAIDAGDNDGENSIIVN